MSENYLHKQLAKGSAELSLTLSEQHIEQMLELCNLLVKWNKKFNLTSITDPSEIITKHILDSLSLLSHIHGNRVLDVGTGAGFPGLPLAMMLPEVDFTLLDSNRKKISFIQHVATRFRLDNVHATHSRIQDLVIDKPFTSITSRAFADLNDFLEWLPGNCVDENTQILAMKGKIPEEELATMKNSLLSSQWELEEIIDLEVPGLDAERCVVKLGVK